MSAVHSNGCEYLADLHLAFGFSRAGYLPSRAEEFAEIWIRKYGLLVQLCLGLCH